MTQVATEIAQATTDEPASLTAHVKAGFREFFRWLLLTGMFGVILGGIAAAFLSDNTVAAGVVFGLTLVETFILAILLSSKRAIFRVVLRTVQNGRLLRNLVGSLFDRVIYGGGTEEKPVAGTSLGERVERIPFAEAERRLNAAVSERLRSQSDSRRLRDRLKLRAEIRLTKLIRSVTLARFRKHETDDGRIDLTLVRGELEDRADALVTSKAETVIRVWTIGVLVALPVVVAIQTWAAWAILKWE